MDVPDMGERHGARVVVEPATILRARGFGATTAQTVVGRYNFGGWRVSWFRSATLLILG
jgi:hypothetical protein